MKVWRVENDKGVGPYQGTYPITFYTWPWSTQSHGDRERHPSYYGESFTPDVGAVRSRDLYFGFESREQAEDWFTAEEFENLANLGFTLRQVEAERVYYGRRQVVFTRPSVPTQPTQPTLAFATDAQTPSPSVD